MMRVNVGGWVARNARIYPRKVAVKSGARSLTYFELAGRVARLALGLRGAGLAKGDRVAILLPNGIEYVEAIFACSAVGLIAVPLNWRLGQEELARILADCAPRALVAGRDLAATAGSLAAGCPSIGLSLEVDPLGGLCSYETLLSGASACSSAGAETGAGMAGGAGALSAVDGEAVVDPNVGGDDPHLIMYTAGTTGDPKGVVLTHSNCFWQSVNGWALGVSPDTVALVVLPLFHVGGLNGSLTPMIHVGATVIIPPRFDVGEVLATIERERVTGMLAVPTIYQRMLEHPAFAMTDLSSVEAFISGGAPLPEALIRAYHQRGLEFRQGYGLTETSPGATGMGPGECLRKAGTAGRPCLYVDIAVVDEHGRPLPAGTPGEVCVRGPNVMAGYWNRPEETTRVIVDGWLHTGDIGLLDDDSFLTLIDRKKEMIVSGGENIYPAEVERTLAGHPLIADVAVLGRPDASWGEVPVAFVVPRPGASVSSDDVLTFCAGRLARYKTPREVIPCEVLPRNAAGKLLKSELRKQLGGRARD